MFYRSCWLVAASNAEPFAAASMSRSLVIAASWYSSVAMVAKADSN